ncbi:MAG: penicillin-binding protein 2 [Dehalococcoidia bacterium]
MIDDNWHGPKTPSRNRPHGNLGALRLAVLALFAILAAQLFRMQIVDGASYAQRSRENHITAQTTLAPRGLIYDRNGEPLVANESDFIATIVPELLPDSTAVRYEMFLTLERITGKPALEIHDQVNSAIDRKQAYIEIAVQKYLTKEQALILAESATDMPGVQLTIRPGRRYTAGPAFSHILGYTGLIYQEEYASLQDEGYGFDDTIGKTGVEAWYEKYLRGKPGVTAAEQDAQGRLVQSFESTDPVPGNSVKLAIDAGLQTRVAELLQDALPANDEKNGDAHIAAAVVMSPRTGEVYALVSVPDYDNNLFSQPEKYEAAINQIAGDLEFYPLLSKALSPAAPGSTFKLITAAAALQVERIKPTTTINVTTLRREVKLETGELYPLVDWRVHGVVDLYSAIAWSSNQYFFQASCGILGESRGLDRDFDDSATILAYYARQFGLGAVTGIDIGGEEPGRVPDPAWKKRVHADDPPGDQAWYYGDTCNMGIGQGDITATPLQIARMTAAVANGGKLLTPHVATAIVSPDGKVVRTIEPEWKQVPVDERYLADIRRGMHESVGYGAGELAASSGMDVAGKTGTAEFTDYKTGRTYEHAWFTGFAPFNDPEVVVTVYFDRGVGGQKAAPVAREIIRYFNENVKR